MHFSNQNNKIHLYTLPSFFFTNKNILRPSYRHPNLQIPLLVSRHNINRGFFFSHMGWLLVKKHPLVKEKGATLDMSDLTSEPVLMFQRKSVPLPTPYPPVKCHSLLSSPGSICRWSASSAFCYRPPFPSIFGAKMSSLHTALPHYSATA